MGLSSRASSRPPQPRAARRPPRSSPHLRAPRLYPPPRRTPYRPSPTVLSRMRRRRPSLQHRRQLLPHPHLLHHTIPSSPTGSPPSHQPRSTPRQLLDRPSSHRQARSRTRRPPSPSTRTRRALQAATSRTPRRSSHGTSSSATATRRCGTIRSGAPSTSRRCSRRTTSTSTGSTSRPGSASTSPSPSAASCRTTPSSSAKDPAPRRSRPWRRSPASSRTCARSAVGGARRSRRCATTRSRWRGRPTSSLSRRSSTPCRASCSTTSRARVRPPFSAPARRPCRGLSLPFHQR